MTLKNSFLVRLLENGKRRLWLLVVAVLLFVIAIPIYTAMAISLIQATEESVGFVKMQMQLYQSMRELFVFNSFIAFFTGCFAVLSGIQGFSYLYDRSKIDFYHSKPVMASKRFITIWLNGLLVYMLPFILGNTINVLLVAASGVLDGALILTLAEAIVIYIAFYIAVYSIVILAVMLTGKTLITLMGICVFLFYEMAVRSLITGYCSFSFHFYSGYGDRDWYVPLLSPFYMIDKYYTEEMGMLAVTAGLLVFAAAVLALAYWCYKKRPSELAGSAMTFQGIKPLIKIGISVPVALLAGMATAGLMDYSPLDASGSPFFPILLGALFIILSNALIQVIYEADIRGMFHKKCDILVTAVLTLVIMLVFRYDLIGFDNYIPKLEKIESAVIVTDTNQRYSRMYYDENMKQLNKEEYLDKYMYLTGEDAENVRELALYSIEQYQKYPNRRAFIDADHEHTEVIYRFRLKNGKTVERAIPVLLRDETTRGIINKIEASENFVRINEPAMSEYLSEAIENGKYKIDAYWGGDINRQDMTSAQAKEFLNLYQKDLLNDSYIVKSTELPIGQVDLYLDMQISYGRRIAMPVYPSYTNSVTFLNENGFKTDKFVSIEDIDRIQISKYYETEEKNVMTESVAGFEEAVAGEVEGKTCTADYVNVAEIEEIINNAYPISLDWEYWYQEYPFDEADHRITVYFKEGTNAFEDYGSVADFCFLKDRVPDYVLEDLPKDMVPEE